MSDVWDQRYDREDYLFGTRPSAFVERHAPRLAAGSSLLLPADGEGRNSVYLAGLGHLVTATDSSRVALQKARALAATQRVSVNVQLCSIEDYDWPVDAFDAVIGVFIQFAPPDQRKTMFEGMKRATRPGGLVMLHGYTPEQLTYKTGGPSQMENLYTETMLEDAFRDFRIDVLASYVADLDEGEGHKGRSALVDLIAVKPA
ncbi:cyclopropane-fatty-acyl-phospholipid synthase family protein [Asticcacaulis sp. AND118]|uniref:SAM-dependent methyltransferase n=1 Tax=Asticcacaulis sp. AND118 TaxID=2840468 RepID=UPI001CFFCE0B|nr:class I SAM-dependent methyltransferase [Asticcacaulis sp. AND118]UDF05784.1 class I SAM-dependent methyltransferase [Asticcacaulis sp. AND118]